MKSTIGLLVFGLILRNGLADVSHLPKPGHNHYLPPPVQDLPVDQDYNGLDSQPQNGLHNDNHGYLPPYQHGRGQGQQYDDDYDHNVEISYNNDFAVHQPQGQIDDQAHGGHDDDQNDDHVDIDHQQLEPIFPPNFPVQGFYMPNGENQVVKPSGQRQGKPGRGEGHSISLIHYQHGLRTVSSPRPFTQAQATPHPAHGGYDYPKPTKSADFLYSNDNSEANSDLSEPVEDGEAEAQRDYLPPVQGQTHLSQGQGPDYLPPVQTSHGGRQQQEHVQLGQQVPQQQDYSAPIQSNHGHLEAERGYLPPAHSSHSHQGHQQDYQSPVQSNLGHQDYLPPATHDHHSQGLLNQNHARPSSVSHSHQQHHHHPQGNQLNSDNSVEAEYLPPVQSSHAHHSSHNLQSQSNVDVPEHGPSYLAPPSNDLPSTQYDSLHDHPAIPVTEAGHINVPLPIPQVGYFFIPGIVSRIPSASDAKNLRPVLNIPGIIGSEPPKPRPTQRINSSEYTRAFLVNKKNRQPEQKTSNIVITPSVQTQNSMNQHRGQEAPGNLDFASPNQNLHTHINYLKSSELGNDNRQYLPPHDQTQDQLSHDHQQEIPSHESKPNQGLHTHVSGGHTNQPLNPNSFQGMTYLPPAQDHHHHQQEQVQQDHHHDHHDHHAHHDHQNQHDHRDHQSHHHHNEPLNQRQTFHQESIVRGYLPPDNQNEITSLKTYMNTVHPTSDRYGSAHFHQPPQNEKGNPPPPAGTSPPMFSSPSAIKAYAPGMAYRVNNNAPFSTFTPATYLPPVENPQPTPSEDAQDDSVPLGFQLNEEAKRNLAKIMPKDNTIFPLDALLGGADGEIDLPDILMDQLRGRIRTVQIVNNHDNSAKTFRVLETADHKGVKTIKILGHTGEDPMGDHKVIRIISQGPHPGGFHQTVKIFSDHKEVTLPTTNAYLPPPKAKETFGRVLRNSQNELRSH